MTGLVLPGALALVLAGCGAQPPAVSVTQEGVTAPEVVLASPAASPFPDARVIEASGVEVKLENGKLSPDRIEGDIGSPMVITVTGDGTKHELSIEGLVDKHEIAAEGQTTVSFTIDGDPRETPITIDGKPAGTFAAQLPGGITDE
ncbi:MAG: hypothetical protein IT337_07150 [Thermomicrobiales bacterium]|nr:hypothetical protein [Thermomicrobiales bacterium]